MPGSVNSDRVFAVLLAAGASTRFGASKQLAKYDGEPLVTRAMRLANQTCGDHTVLVTGHAWSNVRAACRSLPGFFVINEHYTQGIGSSLALSVRAVRHTARAVLVLLADQPLITPEHLRALLSAWSGDDKEIVASAYANTTGVPALFPAGCFDRLCALDGDVGAQSLLHDTDFVLRKIDCAAAATDIDTPADLPSSVNNVHS
jgi:molybdenum cofactor cytidylyltransferase